MVFLPAGHIEEAYGFHETGHRDSGGCDRPFASGGLGRHPLIPGLKRNILYSKPKMPAIKKPQAFPASPALHQVAFP
jgi:hypothetical protein